MKTVLKILDVKDVKVLKVIKIVGAEWNWFTGYLPYLRTLNPNYDYHNGDLLDSNLLDSFKKIYPSSFLIENRLILIEGELEERMKAIESGSQKKLTVNFFPYVDYPYERIHELAGKEFTSYLLDFTLRLDLSESNDKFKYIHDSNLCYVNFEQIDRLIKTIQTI